MGLIFHFRQEACGILINSFFISITITYIDHILNFSKILSGFLIKILPLISANANFISQSTKPSQILSHNYLSLNSIRGFPSTCLRYEFTSLLYSLNA